MEISHLQAGGSRRAMLGGAAVAAAGLLAALALVFTNATGVTEVADQARVQQQLESAIGTVASARTAVGNTLLIATAFGDEVATNGAMDDAYRVLDALEQRVAAVSGLLDDPAPIDVALDEALVEGRRVLSSITDGDLPRAAAIAAGPAAGRFDALGSALGVERDAVASQIAAAAGQSSTVATASRFMVAFFVPALAVLVVVFGARRRRKREALAIALEHERQVNRSKDQLIANLSHELRTPLTGIYTAALALEDAGFSEPALSHELNGMIIEQSADLTRMVEDLLVSAQADAGRLRFDLEPTSVPELVASLGAEFSRSGASIGVDVAPGHVLADGGRLRQVLRNLVSNAHRYGGDDIRIEGRVVADRYVISVMDDGDGVPQDLQERLFERFVHQGDAPLVVGSVGLGLAISRVLARGMRGDIAYRREGGYTVFEVQLGRTTDPGAQMPPDPAPHEAPGLVDEPSDVTD